MQEIALILTLAACSWVLVSAALAARPWRRGVPMMLPALCTALWTGGQLGVLRAATPEGVLLSRRVLWLGGLGLALAWYWSGKVLARSFDRREGRVLLWVLAVPLVAAYACLYVPNDDWLTSWTEVPPRHGMMFWAILPYTWGLTMIGTAALVTAAQRLGQGNPMRVAAIVIGACLPLCAHVFHHVTLGDGSTDLTPVVVGAGLMLIQLALVDADVNGLLPLARLEVIEHLGNAVLTADLEGIVVDVNPAARRLSAGRELLGRSLDDVITMLARAPGACLELETFVVHGRFGQVGRFAVLSDRTEARRTERQLLQTHKLQALGVLTAGIAHEVNNPLAFVRANLAGLEELALGLRDPLVRHALPQKLAELAADAPDLVAESIEGVDRIGRLVRRLRSFARADGESLGERQRVALGDVVRKAAVVAGAGLEEGALRILEEPAPRVRASEDELVQIALNLIVNAVQASPAGAPPIEILTRRAAGGASLVVRDRGSGIPEDVLPHLFDPFFTTKPPGEGTGLGLSLSFDLARQNGGRLEARNRPGGGAEFELWLPAAEEPSHDNRPAGA
ncbi:MAG TPA: ATP-binding protein [Myxococcota bacterium]|jgi:signal transduction histidine kinase|nr:ATP-binding protein [Myxococcota bacterium]